MGGKPQATDVATTWAQACAEQDVLLRSVGENLPGIIYRVAAAANGERRFHYVSAGVEKLLGLKPADVLADSACLYRLIVEEDLPRVMAEEEKAFLANGPFDCAFRLHTVAGEIRWLHCRSAPRALSDGSVIWDGLALDVTRIKQHEQELERYRLLAQGTRDIVLFLRPDGAVVDANAAALAAYGYAREELIGLNIRELRDPATAEQIAQQIAEADQHGILFETVHRRKDGTLFPVEVNSRGAALGGEQLLLSIVRDISERFNAEQELRQNEQRYRVLIQSGSDVFWRWNPATNERDPATIEWWKALTGVEVENGDPPFRWLEAVHPDDRSYAAAWQRSVSSGEPYEIEYRVRSMTGEYRAIRVRGTPIRDAKGAIREWVGLLSDVTEQRRDEQQIRAMAAIVESSDDAIIGKDLDGKITSWNTGATRLYNYMAEEAVGQNISILIPPELQDEEPNILARLHRGEQIAHYETVRVAKGGRRIDVSLTVSPIRDANGNVVGASKIARDITEQKRANAALHFLSEASGVLASSLNYEETLSAVAKISVPILADWCAVDIVQPDGTLDRVAVAHTSPEKVQLAREMHQLYPPDPETSSLWRIIRMGKSELVSNITDAMLAESVKNPELLATLRSLGLRSYIGVPLRIRERTLGAITFIAAESGRQFNANDLALAEDLAHRAAVAIENARLYAEMSEASRRKDEFLATLAHELRNPLAPIRNALELFRLVGPNEATLLQARDIIERQVDQLTRLVDDLLDVSRFTRGKMELRKQRIALAAVVERALEMSRPLIDAASHTLVVEQSPEPLHVEGDITRLAQALGNLLNNSAKYTEPGGRITLTTSKRDNQAIISVRDNGIGISAEMLSHIFDPFVQVDSSIERRQGGLGIGLTLVQNLVALHGGMIEAASAGAGQGSVFTIRLPVATAEAKAATPPTAPAPSLNEKPNASGRRILVADDNKDSADTLAMLLRMLGNEVKTVYNGPEALKLASSYEPQWMVLDIGMPEMSGYEVARRLRQEPRFQNVRLIAMTGWGQEEDRRRTREAGFDHHLVKPVDLQALQQLLNAST